MYRFKFPLKIMIKNVKKSGLKFETLLESRNLNPFQNSFLTPIIDISFGTFEKSEKQRKERKPSLPDLRRKKYKLV